MKKLVQVIQPLLDVVNIDPNGLFNQKTVQEFLVSRFDFFVPTFKTKTNRAWVIRRLNRTTCEVIIDPGSTKHFNIDENVFSLIAEAVGMYVSEQTSGHVCYESENIAVTREDRTETKLQDETRVLAGKAKKLKKVIETLIDGEFDRQHKTVLNESYPFAQEKRELFQKVSDYNSKLRAISYGQTEPDSTIWAYYVFAREVENGNESPPRPRSRDFDPTLGAKAMSVIKIMFGLIRRHFDQRTGNMKTARTNTGSTMNSDVARLNKLDAMIGKSLSSIIERQIKAVKVVIAKAKTDGNKAKVRLCATLVNQLQSYDNMADRGHINNCVYWIVSFCEKYNKRYKATPGIKEVTNVIEQVLVYSTELERYGWEMASKGKFQNVDQVVVAADGILKEIGKQFPESVRLAVADIESETELL